MNSNTRVGICCYTGDQQQVIDALGLYLHHECPVVILSPEDAPVTISHPRVENRFGGKRAYIGQDSIDRQRDHLRIMLSYTEEFFLLNDSDSVCLSPKIPEYLYSEDVLWSNLVADENPGRETGHYPEGFPHIAFQPPYFFSRKVLERLLACVAEGNIDANPQLPFIDHYMVQLAVKAGVPWKNFAEHPPLKYGDGLSLPMADDKCMRLALNMVRNQGTVFIHSVKAPQFWQPLVEARRLYGTTS